MGMRIGPLTVTLFSFALCINLLHTVSTLFILREDNVILIRCCLTEITPSTPGLLTSPTLTGTATAALAIELKKKQN